MDTRQLLKILREHLANTWYGVYAEDRLPDITERPRAIIVNTDPADKSGTHWTAIYLKSNGKGEFFDSYGREPDIPVQYYMDRHAPDGWLYNTRKVQGYWSTLCGAYCLQYLEARNEARRKPLSSLLLKLFPNSNNDRLVQQRMIEHYKFRIPIYDRSFFTQRTMYERTR